MIFNVLIWSDKDSPRVDGDHYHLSSPLSAASAPFQYRSAVVWYTCCRQPSDRFSLTTGSNGRFLSERRFTIGGDSNGYILGNGCLYDASGNRIGHRFSVSRTLHLASKVNIQVKQ